MTVAVILFAWVVLSVLVGPLVGKAFALNDRVTPADD